MTGHLYERSGLKNSMASVLENTGIRDALLRLDVDQYHRLCASGIIPEQTELLDGVIVEKMGKSPLRSWTVAVLAEWLRANLREGLLLRLEQPLTLGQSEPGPDLAVVDDHRDDYRSHHPQNARIVIEVAVTTVNLDCAKAEIYAQAGISHYLIVLPEQKRVIVHRHPLNAVYARVETLEHGGLTIEGICDGSLPLIDLFPA